MDVYGADLDGLKLALLQGARLGLNLGQLGYAGAMTGLGLVAWLTRRHAKLQAAEHGRERRMREELEAYAKLDLAVVQGVDGRADPALAAKALAVRVCRTVADKSVFTRVMMLLRNAEGSMRCVGSIGVDDLTVAAIERWGEQVMQEERGAAGGTDWKEGAKQSAGPGAGRGLGKGKSLSIPLGPWRSFDPEVSTWKMSGKTERRQWRRALVFPIRTGDEIGRLAGAIVVCSDGLALPRQNNDGRVSQAELRTDKLVSGLETLAARLGMAMENEALGERLLRAEKLAGLGQLADGVAHALNNPLTAVLGYAELIAETSGEARVQEDARTIAREALKMKATVERLVDFWQPPALTDEPVNMLALLYGMADECRPKLETGGVKLEISAHAGGSSLTSSDSEVPAVRGCGERLRQVMEHLLNNAAQAITEARAREMDEEHAIRISLHADDKTLHVIVSDTGTGFEEPGRAFDPFYTTKDPVEGAGMGLSICYGIVREHGGEIAAFNLHPHGAAVVVDLPLAAVMKREPVSATQTSMYVH